MRIRNSKKLSNYAHHKIKELLWDGCMQQIVAMRFNKTQGHISKIATGHVAPDIPWPDGSVGGLSYGQAIEIKQRRRAKELSLLQLMVKGPVA